MFTNTKGKSTEEAIFRTTKVSLRGKGKAKKKKKEERLKKTAKK